MRDYGKVYSQFWNSEDIRSLSHTGRLLALYLMTCEHGTLAGVFRLPDAYVCEDIQLPSETVAEGFGELLRKGFATRCERTHWVWITKYLEWNEPENPNQVKALAKILTRIPNSCSWRPDFQQVYDDLTASMARPAAKGSRNPSPTVSKPGSGSGSGSGAGTGTGTVHVRRDDDASSEEADAAGEHAHRGGENFHLNGKGSEPTPEHNGHEANGHDPTDPSEPSSFALLREIYPARSGSQRWADALKLYRANLKAGYSHQQMLDGTMRYARYCKAEDILGTPTVQQASTFLGDNLGFLETWKSSEKPKRESPGERWAREEGAKDAAR